MMSVQDHNQKELHFQNTNVSNDEYEDSLQRNIINTTRPPMESTHCFYMKRTN
jgi:hypothetical protein